MSLKDSIIYYLICLYVFITPLIPVNVKPSKLHWLSEVILLIIILLFIIKNYFLYRNKVLSKDAIKDIINDKISLFMLILSVIMLISVSYSTEKKLALSETIRFFSYFLAYYVIKYEINNNIKVRGILNSYLLSCFVVSTFGIIQFFTGLGLAKNFLEASYTRIKIASTLDNPNSLAAFAILALFPVVMISICEKNIKKKLMYSSLSILILINAILTFSRNSLIGIFVGMCVLAVVYSWRLIPVIGISIITAISIPQIAHRIKDLDNYTQNMSRIYLWKIALKMIKEHPIFGVGNGNYISLYDEYVRKYPQYSYGYSRFSVHNSYLKIQSELGILGGVSFISIILAIIYKVNKFISGTSNKFYKYFYTGFLASFVAFLVMNLFDNLYFVPKVITYLWCMVAVLQSIENNKIDDLSNYTEGSRSNE